MKKTKQGYSCLYVYLYKVYIKDRKGEKYQGQLKIKFKKTYGKCEKNE